MSIRAPQFITAASAIAFCTNLHALDDLEFSGFARVFAGYLDTDQATYKGYEDSLSLKPNSLLGFQADYAPLENFSITTQGIWRAEDSDNIDLEWLYLTYQPTESVQAKAGRLRAPLFAVSDFVDVGYAYPWIQPPQQIYDAYLFQTYEGVDFIYSYSFANISGNIEFYYGGREGSLDLGEINFDYEMSNLWGIIGDIQWGNLQVRTAYYQTDLAVAPNFITDFSTQLYQLGFTQSAETLILNGKGHAKQFSFNYDNVHYFLRGEFVDIVSGLTVFPQSKAYYLSAGVYLNPLTPYFSWAQNKNTNGQPANEIPVGVSPLLDQLNAAYRGIFSQLSEDNLTSYTIGLRWDIKKDLAFKTEYTHLKGKPGEDSFFIIEDESFDRKANLLTFGFDWVF